MTAIRNYFNTQVGLARDLKSQDLVRLRTDLGDLKLTVIGPYDKSLDLWTVAVNGVSFVISGAVLEKRDPQWRPGDVIVVQHHGYGPPYTYVRSTSGWLTEHGTKTDETVTKWYRAGWVTPKLQAGGIEFDTSRL